MRWQKYGITDLEFVASWQESENPGSEALRQSAGCFTFEV